MEDATATDNRVRQDLASLAAAGLQLPAFLVLSTKPDGRLVWLEAGLVPVAEHWLANACREPLLPQAPELVSQLAVAMSGILESFLALHAEGASEQQRHWLAWDMQRAVVIDWLADTGIREVNAAALAWSRMAQAAHPADEADAASRTWDLVHTLPELSGLHDCLLRQMAQPPAVEPEAAPRICGMRPIR
ncbi:hypothetical protein LK540_21175 [Massilia sp. IC2-278]|uniref:hypothetical protein n=1 Tax=Massilia sp. IC2-278 TaxID=2887200 RepID=UPI001E45AC3D|nr:hypothetical protein [Massilia sp. IC2-278]MCC2962950.1 hypothetical protein [Massilia sp. IC2-278]